MGSERWGCDRARAPRARRVGGGALLRARRGEASPGGRCGLRLEGREGHLRASATPARPPAASGSRRSRGAAGCTPCEAGGGRQGESARGAREEEKSDLRRCGLSAPGWVGEPWAWSSGGPGGPGEEKRNFPALPLAVPAVGGAGSVSSSRAAAAAAAAADAMLGSVRNGALPGGPRPLRPRSACRRARGPQGGPRGCLSACGEGGPRGPARSCEGVKTGVRRCHWRLGVPASFCPESLKGLGIRDLVT